MNKIKYKEAIRVCSLDKDIESFDYGDLTEIGQRGLNLTGGQKQRLQLQFALEQQDRRAPTLNASRFLPFWNRAKPSGSRATQEEALNNDQTVNMLPVAVIAIPIHELKDITDNFSSGCLIDNRSGEDVYCGTLKSGQDAEIKKLCYRNLPDKEFLEKVSLISSFKHGNLAQLLGYCMDGRQQFLAYEFAQNGSLYDMLRGFYGSKPVPVLSWVQRVEIAVGAAKGLEYIHRKKHIHHDIRSCNVLVYNEGVVKLVDFGLPTHFAYKRLYDYSDDHPFAFMRPQDSPEYVQDGEVSWRCNVYSFGWVLLELLTGSNILDHAQHLLERAKSKLSEDNVRQIVDARLNGDYPPKAVAKMAAVAALCVQREAELRPDMSTVVRALRRLLKDCSATET